MLTNHRPIDDADSDVAVADADETIALDAGTMMAQQADPPVHPELAASNDDAVTPSAVQNGRMLCTYVGMGLERVKGKKFIHLDFSFPLEAAHSGLIPQKVINAMDYLLSSGDKLHACQNLPPVTLDVYIGPKEKRSLLHLPDAKFTRAIVADVEETGKLKVHDVIRFNFRLLVERDDKVIDFATKRDTEEFWVVMPATQPELPI